MNCRLARDLWAQGSGGPLVAEGARKARDETPAKASDTEGRMTSRSTGAEVSRALVDHIPVVWVEPTQRQREVPLALWLHTR
jgi:hypothetical protein